MGRSAHSMQANMKLVQLLCVIASVVCGPQRSFPRINVERYVKKALRGKYPEDKRVSVDVDARSPSSLAAVAYVRSTIKDGLCGDAAEAYVESILKGDSREEAAAEDTSAYITAFNNGTRYVRAILAGKSHLQANTLSMRGFIKAFKQLAGKGKPLNDVACHNAARAFYDAVPEKPDPVIGAAFTAFSDKIFSGNVIFDPVCLAAMETFIDSQADGDDLLTANLKAARSFFKAF